MSAEIIHPPSTDTFAVPNVALTPGFFSLPSLANETWSLNDTLPTPPIPSWAIKPDPDDPRPTPTQHQPQTQFNIDPALQPTTYPKPDPNSPQYQSRSQSQSLSSSPPPSKRHHPYSSTTAQDRLKRENFLARNRKAASKCRQKKKKHNEELASQYERVARQKKHLQSEAEYLRAQVLQLKDELLRHSQCNDVQIKGHLARMVNQVTRKSETFIDIKSLLASPTEQRAQSYSSGSASAEADSPLLQEVMEMERRGEEWRRRSDDTQMSGSANSALPALRRDDSFADLIDYG